MQNDKSYFTYGNFESNPPSTVNTAKFDCLDLSGPPCTLVYGHYRNACFICDLFSCFRFPLLSKTNKDR